MDKQFLSYIRGISREIGKANLTKAATTGKRFYMGSLNISDGVRALGYTLNSKEVQTLIQKYEECDWGEGWEDAEINERAIETGYGDIMGVYRLSGEEIWIKTDLNESPCTTIFLPEER